MRTTATVLGAVFSLLAVVQTSSGSPPKIDAALAAAMLTPFQRRFLAANRATATAADARARPALLAALDNRATRAHLRSVRGIEAALPNLPAPQLVDRLERELAASEVLHTFPASVATALARGECGAMGCADTDLAVERRPNTTWIHNEWELPLLGDRCTPPPWHNGSAQSQKAAAAEPCGTEDWLWGCDLAERNAFCAQRNYSLCFPPFSSRRAGVNHQTGPLAWPANLSEAAERPVYHSSNFHRQPAPVHQFGSVTFVMNRSLLDPLTFIFPVDSGDFEGFCGGKNAFENHGSRFVNCSAFSGEMGAPPSALSHSVLAWAGYANATAGKDALPLNLANLMAGLTLPWEIAGRPVGSFVASQPIRYDQEDWYWEANTVGRLPYPASVTMVIGSYAELFGSTLGQELRELCTRWGWPLAWALGQPPGDSDDWLKAHVNATVARLLDPTVLGHSRAGWNLTAAAKNTDSAFAAAWRRAAQHNGNATGWEGAAEQWEALNTEVPSALKIEPMRAGQCAGQAHGLCVGLSSAGCVCYR